MCRYFSYSDIIPLFHSTKLFLFILCQKPKHFVCVKSLKQMEPYFSGRPAFLSVAIRRKKLSSPTLAMFPTVAMPPTVAMSVYLLKPHRWSN